MTLTTTLDLLYLAGAIALVGVALLFTHKAETHGKVTEEKPH